MNFLYVKIGVACVLLFGAFATGWALRNRDYMDYKKEVYNAQKAQEAHVESIKKQQTLVNKGIEDEYNAKLTLLRQYYANGVRQPSSSGMSNLSNTASIANATAAYTELIGQCAETTQQLVSLQAWINEQMGIK